MTLIIFKLSEKIPVAKDKLFIKHSCSAVSSLVNFNVFIEVLFIPVALVLQRLDIISRILFLVQGDISEKFTLIVKNYFQRFRFFSV